MPNYTKRLIDILTQYDTPPPDDHQIFIADDVQYQIDADPTLTEDVRHGGDYYGIVAPPFKQFWVEARTHPDFFDDSDVTKDVIMGASVTVDEIERYSFMPEGATNETRWIMAMQMFRYEELNYAIARGVPTKGIMACLEIIMIPVTGEGVAQFKDGLVSISDIPAELRTQKEFALQVNQARHPDMLFVELENTIAVTAVPMVLKAINALHQRCEIAHIEYPRNYVRRTERKHGYTPHNNYYLKVGASDKRTYPVISSAGNAKNGKRTHHRVGHFAYYSEDKPHVSGFTGMMWRNATIVNSGKREKINKRYTVSD